MFLYFSELGEEDIWPGRHPFSRNLRRSRNHWLPASRLGAEMIGLVNAPTARPFVFFIHNWAYEGVNELEAKEVHCRGHQPGPQRPLKKSFEGGENVTAKNTGT